MKGLMYNEPGKIEPNNKWTEGLIYTEKYLVLFFLCKEPLSQINDLYFHFVVFNNQLLNNASCELNMGNHGNLVSILSICWQAIYFHTGQDIPNGELLSLDYYGLPY